MYKLFTSMAVLLVLILSIPSSTNNRHIASNKSMLYCTYDNSTNTIHKCIAKY